MVTSTCSSLLAIKLKSLNASRTSLRAARGIIEVDLGQRFYVLLTNLSEKQVFTQKHIIITLKLDRPQLASTTEATSLKTDPDKVVAVCYKPSVVRSTQMSRRKAIEKHDDEKINLNWKEKANYRANVHVCANSSWKYSTNSSPYGMKT